MASFYNASTGEIREIDQQYYDSLVAAGNPKATAWVPVAAETLQKPTEFHSGGTVEIDGGVASVKWTAPDLASVKARAIERLSEIRRAKIDAGFAFGGITAPCDDESQRVYTAAYVLAKDFPQMKRKWKLPSGFVELGSTELQQLAILASQHVQACFDWQAEQVALIEAAKDVAQVDAILKAAQ